MSRIVNISEFRELITNIKNMSIDSDNPQDKQVVHDLLKVLKYICEFDILSMAYDDSEKFNSIVPNIDIKLLELEMVITDIKQKYKTQGGLSPAEIRTLQAARLSYNRYQEIKDAIETRNFEHYVESMNKNLNNATQVISVCSSALAIGEENYLKLFDEKIVDKDNNINENPLNILYRIINNASLFNELKNYCKREGSIQNANDKIEKDKKFLEYIRLASEHFQILREYITSKSVLGESGKNKECVLNSRLSKSKLKLEELSQGFLSSIRNIREKNKLQAQIFKDESELERIQKRKPQIMEFERKLREVGLGPIIGNFDYSIDNKDNSPEQAAIDYIRVNMNRFGLDISDVEQKIQYEIVTLESKVERGDNVINDSFEHLSPYAQTLVTNFHDDIVKIVDLVENKDSFGVTPLLAAYVLKALTDAKNINFAELNGIIKSYDHNGIAALVDSYRNIVINTTNNINSTLTDVSERSVYDIEPFGELKIK